MKQLKHAVNYPQWAHLVLEKTFPHSRDHRWMLGIAGSPASGKSTFAENLVQAINKVAGHYVAVCVPMDGFHFSNEKLEEMQLRHLKGIPATFDAEGYVQCIERLRTNLDAIQHCPLFDRSIEASDPTGVTVKPEHRIIVSEGNYLLLEDEPWNRLRTLFDEIWFLDATEEELFPRLMERHLVAGRDEQAALEKIASTDLPNSRLIQETKPRAHRVILFTDEREKHKAAMKTLHDSAELAFQHGNIELAEQALHLKFQHACALAEIEQTDAPTLEDPQNLFANSKKQQKLKESKKAPTSKSTTGDTSKPKRSRK